MTPAAELKRVADVREKLASGEARRVRLARNIRLSEAARAVGVSSSALCRWESGKLSPRYQHAARYARVLDGLG